VVGLCISSDLVVVSGFEYFGQNYVVVVSGFEFVGQKVVVVVSGF
jgi:hypothetical protein